MIRKRCNKVSVKPIKRLAGAAKPAAMPTPGGFPPLLPSKSGTSPEIKVFSLVRVISVMFSHRTYNSKLFIVGYSMYFCVPKVPKALGGQIPPKPPKLLRGLSPPRNPPLIFLVRFPTSITYQILNLYGQIQKFMLLYYCYNFLLF